MGQVVARGRGLFVGRNRQLRWRAGALVGSVALGLATVAVLGSGPAGAVTTWSPAGGCGYVQSTTVPANVYEMTVDVSGGNGGKGGGEGGGTTGPGGAGAHLQVKYSVAPGDVISAIVGCNGNNGTGSSATAGVGGWSSGGGTGQGQDTIFDQHAAGGGSGGGSSAVCLGSNCVAGSSTPLVVAGGGGGSGSSSCSGTTGGSGGTGNGGGSYSSINNGTGVSGSNGGPGATSGSYNNGISGGAGGVNASGGNPNGGTSPNGSGGAYLNVVGGGGGGGYVGGGAGANASGGCEAGGAGGAGSSWYNLGAEGLYGSDVGSGGAVLVQFADPSGPPATTTPPTTVGSPSSWSPGTACGTSDHEVVPPGVFSMTVDVAGGAGGKGGGQSGGTTGNGSAGGEAMATIAVTPGETISAVVGCAGANGDGGNSNDPTPVTPGWSTGGGTGQGQNTALFLTGAAGGGGGGSSAVCVGATCAAGSGTPLVVAGGGGGSGSSSCSGTTGGDGGAAGVGASTSGGGGSGPSGIVGGLGATSGLSNVVITGGAGGSNAAGGSANGGSAPDGTGGFDVNVVGGGGGGGFVGGGAGAGAMGGCQAGGAGGGGSSWIASSATATSFRAATAALVSVSFAAPIVIPPTNVVAATGNAQATVSWTAPKASGIPITGYVVTPYQDGVVQPSQTFASTATKEVVTNLLNGSVYTFTVATLDAQATSSPSALSPPVTVGVPGQPVLQSATPGNASAKVAWFPPVGNGAAVTSVTITPSIAGVAQTPQVFASAANSEVVTGLTNGTSYTFTIVASNLYGSGLVSPPTAAIVVGVPGVPTSPVATTANASAKVSWTAPAANGGPITSYTITPYLGTVAQTPQVFTSAANSEVVTGLTNGKSYTFKVAATNSIGTGATSAASTAIVIGLPGQPVLQSATPGDSSAKVVWFPPAANGGPITSMTITPYIAGVAQTPQVFNSSASSDVVTGLTNGTTYTFTIFATNSVGNGPVSPPTAAIVVGVPGVPTSPVATTGNASAKVSWTAPAANGGPITSYTITPYLAGVAQTPQVFNSSANSDVVTGLTNGSAYTFKVAATNSVGTGATSAASAAVTIGLPGQPVLQTATPGNGTAKVAWFSPAANGGPITSVTITPFIAGVAQTPQVFNSSANSEVVTGLTNGTSYTFTIVATNSIGNSPVSPPTAAIVVGAPVAPATPTAVAGPGQATVSWVAPANNGSAITGYVVTTLKGGVVQGSATFASTALSEIVTGLTSGTAYTFKVSAINGNGTGPLSPASAAVTAS